MVQGSQFLKFRVARWKQLIFPQEVIIDDVRVMTRKRRFPAFWIVKEESIPLRSVASVQITSGLLFSNLIIENSGGPFPIQVAGLPNRHAKSIRQAVEGYKPDFNQDEQPQDMEIVLPKTAKRTGVVRKIFQSLYQFATRNRPRKYTPIVEAWESSWDGNGFDPLLDTKTESSINENANTICKNDLPSIEEALENDNQKKSPAPGWMKELVTPPGKRSSD